MDVLFDCRISCTCHVVVTPYLRHLYLGLDGFRLFASGCRFFEVVVDGCRWFYVVLGGFRSFHVLATMH